MKRKIAITGANGLLGKEICRAFEAKGYEVIKLIREPKAEHEFRFSLNESFDWSQLPEIEGLVHAAYDFSPLGLEDLRKANVQPSIRLLESARQHGVHKIIFLSSMAAFDECKSDYGKGKLELEKAVSKLGGISIRPGLVWGGTGGVFSSLARMVRILPIVPLAGGGNQILYLEHVKDLAKGIVSIYEKSPSFKIEKPIVLAEPTPFSFKDILRKLADQVQKKPMLLPVPWWLLWMPLKIAESIGLKIGFKSDSLISLLNQDPNPDFSDLKKFNIELRKFSG